LEVAAPPYDVVTREEARELARDKPWSFLHVSRPEIDLPACMDPYDPAVYAQGVSSLSRMRTEGILRQDQEPRYYLYRLSTAEGHVQTGLVAVASVLAYENHRIRRHELTLPAKEADRTRHIDALNAQTGPVFLTYRQAPAVDKIVAEVSSQPPEIDFTTPDGVRHALWVIDRREPQEALSDSFEMLDTLYIADGHHRSAAAAQVAKMRRQINPRPAGEEPYDYFLAVLFPDNQVRILEYNRVVADLHGLSPEGLVRRLQEKFRVAPSAAAVCPALRGEFGMYLAGRWYRLQLAAKQIPRDDAVARLDVSLLTDTLLTPILGVGNLRTDPRIGFVGGSKGIHALEAQVDSGQMAVAFTLCPTRMEDLMAVSDAGLLMPPKSTWFDPKLADGLFSHMLV
jgi:uncharacterized protein (DUF1015 family)